MADEFDIRPAPSTRVPATDTPKPAESTDFPVPDHKASKPRGLREVLKDRRSRGEDESTSDGGKAGSPRGRRTTSSSSTPRMPANLGKQIQEFYGTIGMAVMIVDIPCGSAILERAEQLGETGEALCRTSPSARRTYMMLTQGSAWSAHLMPLGTLAVAVGMHHVPALRRLYEQRFASQMEQETSQQDAENPAYGQTEPDQDDARPNGQHAAHATASSAA